jgi:hypothetical protein
MLALGAMLSHIFTSVFEFESAFQFYSGVLGELGLASASKADIGDKPLMAREYDYTAAAKPRWRSARES